VVTDAENHEQHDDTPSWLEVDEARSDTEGSSDYDKQGEASEYAPEPLKVCLSFLAPLTQI
jgi:hypothetical protein